MTTICWDGKSLAADRQHSIFRGDAPKIYRLDNGELFGSCGQTQDLHAVKYWLNNGGDKPKVEDGFHGIIIGVNEFHTLENKLVPVRQFSKFFAIGSGRDYAMAAMHLGKSAFEAIAVAAYFDVDTGYSCDVLSLEAEHAAQ